MQDRRWVTFVKAKRKKNEREREASHGNLDVGEMKRSWFEWLKKPRALLAYARQIRAWILLQSSESLFSPDKNRRNYLPLASLFHYPRRSLFSSSLSLSIDSSYFDSWFEVTISHLSFVLLSPLQSSFLSGLQNTSAKLRNTFKDVSMTHPAAFLSSVVYSSSISIGAGRITISFSSKLSTI